MRIADNQRMTTRVMTACSVAALLLLLPGFAVGQQPGMVAIRIVTQLGTVDADLDSARAPATVVNFLRYVDGHLFDGGSFFRVVTMDNQPKDVIRIEVIQGGKRATTDSAFAAVPIERTSITRLRHHGGTLSMARSSPNSARDNFFITIGDQPDLDFGGRRNPDGQGFAAFGHVTAGMDVVRKIQSQPAVGQALVQPVMIVSVTRR
ncbi:peptidylprolyl isomerase [soil metagenome]